jgi:hypothetical protein
MNRFDPTSPAHAVAEALYALNRAIGALEENFAPGAIPNFSEEQDLAMLWQNRDNLAGLLSRLDESFVP